MTEIEIQPIRDYVHQALGARGDTAPAGDSASLVATGRLDSVDVMEIVVFLENEYGLDFADHGFNLDEFDSIDSIFRLAQQLAAAGQV